MNIYILVSILNILLHKYQLIFPVHEYLSIEEVNVHLAVLCKVPSLNCVEARPITAAAIFS